MGILLRLGSFIPPQGFCFFIFFLQPPSSPLFPVFRVTDYPEGGFFPTPAFRLFLTTFPVPFSLL